MIDTVRLGNAYNDEKFTGGNFGGNVWDSNGLAPTMKTGASASQQYTVEIVAMRGRKEGQELEPRKDGITNTITTVQKDNLILTVKEGEARCLRAEQSRAEQSRAEQSSLVYVRQATKDGLIECQVPGIADLSFPTSKTRRGRVIDQGMACPTIQTESIPSVIEPWVWEVDGVKYRIRIRKLTPKECWRLMGFDDKDFESAAEVNSNTQLYKEAGNSIVVNVLEEIFKSLIEGVENG